MKLRRSVSGLASNQAASNFFKGDRPTRPAARAKLLERDPSLMQPGAHSTHQSSGSLLERLLAVHACAHHCGRHRPSAVHRSRGNASDEGPVFPSGVPTEGLMIALQELKRRRSKPLTNSGGPMKAMCWRKRSTTSPTNSTKVQLRAAKQLKKNELPGRKWQPVAAQFKR